MHVYLVPGLLALQVCCATVQATISTSSPIVVSNDVPKGASQIIKDAFISFAIELETFPSFAGNTNTPNTYSDNLLNNIGNLTGVKPYIRVGGNSQDHALYDPTTTQPVIPRTSGDPTIYIGSSFFESFGTWPGAKFSYGLDLGLATTASGWESLVATVPLACNALQDKFVSWEYGNEPDLYTSNGLRPDTFGVAQYVSQWQNGSKQIQASVAQACPDMLNASGYGYIGLSLWGDVAALNPTAVWDDLKTDSSIKMVSFHNYMAGTNTSDLTLQGTLLNHTHTTTSLQTHLLEYTSITSSGIPTIVGEANSIFNIGVAGISDTFGAALWTLDYNLWCASQNLTRVHMQQGLNFLYNAWQPISTPAMPIGTKAPYYGSIAAAAMIGNTTAGKVRIANIPLETGTTDVAYAAYVNGVLARIAVLNMRAYNSTSGAARGSRSYAFSVAGASSTQAQVKVLEAAGSDVLSGISWDGYSYDYELGMGMPVLLGNVTRGGTVPIANGVVTVEVVDSGAVVLVF